MTKRRDEDPGTNNAGPEESTRSRETSGDAPTDTEATSTSNVTERLETPADKGGETKPDYLAKGETSHADADKAAREQLDSERTAPKNTATGGEGDQQ